MSDKDFKNKPASSEPQDELADLAEAVAESAAVNQREELEKLRSEVAEAKDRSLRAQAELENFRKRMRREMEDELRYAQVPLIRDLLPVVDNLHRAIEAAEKGHDLDALLAGVKMVYQQLETTLAKHHCKRIAALNAPFDPALHDALLQQPSADHPPHTVLQVVQAGFQVHDRVVRPSQVIVSAPAPQPPPADDADQDSQSEE